MPHLHGILWLKTSAIEEYLLPNKTFDVNHEDISKFIDKWTSCSRETGNDTLDSIIKEVNIHKHKPSCKKKGTECRFDFPRLPSDHTIVAHPLPKDTPDEERKSTLSEVKAIKDKVRSALSRKDYDPGPEVTLSDLLEELGIPMEKYLWALKISEKGEYVVLKRKVYEAFVNNYNPNYLYAWNANIDIQVCLDAYSVVSYISDYLTKIDSGKL